MLASYIFGTEERFPTTALPVAPIPEDQFRGKAATSLSVTWLGHSTALIEIEGKRILTDPVFARRVSPLPFLGPKRFYEEMPIKLETLPELDLVIISHNHYDHLDKGTIQAIHQKSRRFLVPLGIGPSLIRWGVNQEKITEMDWWDEVRIDDSLRVAATPSRHFSGRGLFDRNKTLWCSWALLGDTQRLFFSGDSGYFDGFKTIGEKYGPFDITLIECGAYSSHWAPIHMVPEESAQAHQDLKGRLMMPIHWGTFNLALHDWRDPMKRLHNAASLANMSVVTPVPGETIDNDTPPSRAAWWRTDLKSASGGPVGGQTFEKLDKQVSGRNLERM
ncbi:hydrolase [Desulfoluna limicola]|uniref:Hydrolase n=2 Tax=Desulfoluna limicola TaxID=2810562 RepID=A0ABN6F724_9BACT|nr:hydrolase [Desulfoluna limicola]